ncbi:FAD:protein FMN transferase [Streptomyces sp. SP17BM10]|uniref:FAD:protein FMN transferase n=1 Tax=Streptomyces sp. SP17BM10 TaxID=3002530 RepID=UPI002E79A8B8|nr:FAD:protein FMN transferase [Streptomyces sp. SP17BM10]MEE1783197.1 FAD:protein FMN transferase [Streptomyces sp. SP17BM10]
MTRRHAVRGGATSFPALGTTATVLTADHRALSEAERILRDELAAVDRACSRFRPDSELGKVNAAAGRPVAVGGLFALALQAALRAAELTDGAVDPTVGRAVTALGYDRSFAALRPQDAVPLPVARPASGWRDVAWDPQARRVRVPRGTTLDLGATAKALAADLACERIAATTGSGVLVNLGGDLATSGPAPAEGWAVGLADDHGATAPGPVVAIASGALATSGTGVRAWRRGGRAVHHIVDPATGRPAESHWRTVTVAAATCVDANTASTAAIVLGPAAFPWLATTGLPARLVDHDGAVTRTGAWPDEFGGSHR